jgi:hypothetical protein
MLLGKADRAATGASQDFALTPHFSLCYILHGMGTHIIYNNAVLEKLLEKGDKGGIPAVIAGSKPSKG